ncbi:MAG: MarR family winged helix-turn-helix transcriptional regulator [Thermoleophilaceae bacterium]
MPLARSSGNRLASGALELACGGRARPYIELVENSGNVPVDRPYAQEQLARAAALSGSATTRLVNRLEDRGLLTRVLCQDDRRGIYTELTQQGSECLAAARPTHDHVLASALDEAEKTPELLPLLAALHQAPPPPVADDATRVDPRRPG